MSDQRVQPLFPDRQPDFGRLMTVVERSGLPDRVPFIELFADLEIVAAVLDEPVVYPTSGDLEQWKSLLLQRIRFCRKVGLDYVWSYPIINFTGMERRRVRLLAEDTAPLAKPARGWVNESEGLISSMAEFEAHPWPTADSVIYAGLDFLAANLPDGMKLIGATAGVMEHTMWLMGFVPFSMALYDDPELVEAITQRIGDIYAQVYDRMAAMPEVGAVFLGDDMGYKQGTFIRPDLMRKYIFPQQKRLVDAAHRHGKPFLLHACGQLGEVMDDLIEIGIDGKHSYEDTFLPVAEAKRLYGDRIAILGGVDVDFLVRSTEDEVRAYTRQVLEACMPGGGYALGTGNSVANYIPVRNYLAMLGAGNQVGRYT